MAKANDSLAVYVSQCDDVQRMRDQMLTFNKTDPNAIRKAIQNVTILRVQHQLKRIIRFTEIIDKLEDRIYQSIDAKLMNSDPDDETMYLTLIPIQERLMKSMIESHKLLEPYLKIEQLSALEVPQDADPTQSFTTMIMEQESRERIRTGVQSLLNVINTFDGHAEDVTAKTAVQSEAQKALDELKSKKNEGASDGES